MSIAGKREEAMNSLKDKEKMIFEYISDTISSEGYPPTVRDIQSALHIKSTSTVHAYLARLEEKGYIRRDPGKSRSVRIDELPMDRSGMSHAKVPVVGRVAAGKLEILAEENIEGYMDFPMMNGSMYGKLFALHVSGTSMINAGILDGDIVVVSQTSYAENGEIVVAMVEDEATVKRFYKENGHFRLQPENPEMEPIIVEDVIILGKVVAVVRYYKR